MNRSIIKTADGSNTVAIHDMNVTYHSKHGAIQESMHVYIEAGFRYQSCRNKPPDPINILEIGFGTGLNAFLTAIEAINRKTKVYYKGLEQYPLTNEEISSLNYTETLEHAGLFQSIHESSWNEDVELNEFFT